jgi:plasmid stability protein
MGRSLDHVASGTGSRGTSIRAFAVDIHVDSASDRRQDHALTRDLAQSTIDETKTVSKWCPMLNLTLKNVPPELHARLKASAEANRRSLNREILARLEGQLDAPPIDVAAELRALEEFVAELPRVDHGLVARYRSAGRA